jgi:hypothetical protein
MKTRRIYLNPNEVVEVINPFGTSVLKAISRFDEDHAVVVVYEQPGVAMLTPVDAQGIGLSEEPLRRANVKNAYVREIESCADITEQTQLDIADQLLHAHPEL